MRSANNSAEVQYSFAPKKQGKFNLLGPYIACLALIMVIVVGIFTIHNWLLYQGLVLSQNKITLDMEKQKEAQTQFLSELTDLMSQQEKTHQYSLQDLEQKMKKSLEERGYNTAHFNSIGSRSMPGSAWLLTVSALLLHLASR